MKTAALKSKEILSHKLRFEAEHYLNDNSFLCLRLERNKDKCVMLETLASVFNPPVFKRQFCRQTTRSVQYFQSSDMQNAEEYSPVYVFRGQAQSLNLLVNKGDILVTGFGTIGNTRLVSRHQDGVCYANNVCRIRVNRDVPNGFIYAFLTSKYGYAQLNNNASGSVVRYIEAPGIKKTLIPNFTESFQKEVDGLIQESTRLREDACDAMNKATRLLKEYASLTYLNESDYDYFGPRSNERTVSCFVRNRKDINSITINAFNHSERIRKTKNNLACITKPLKDVILNGETFSTGSFPRVEVKEGNGIMLINQSDIFNTIIKGKYISKRNVKLSNLVEYGEVLIAGVGTLGENETFCRCIYANEDLVNQLVSGEFIRMKTNNDIPSGYLYTWLSSDYGFRFIRNLQTGTKLCRPIPRLLQEIPIPIIESDKMNEIHEIVTKAHTQRYNANCLVRKAILLVEQEIEKWNN